MYKYTHASCCLYIYSHVCDMIESLIFPHQDHIVLIFRGCAGYLRRASFVASVVHGFSTVLSFFDSSVSWLSYHVF